MATPAQGATFDGLPAGLTNVKVKQTGVDPTSSSSKLDASTLDMDAGSDRLYVDGLPDSGAASVGGITTTITCSFLAESAPTAGETMTYLGQSFKCTEAEIEYAVGELVKGTATYVSIPS